MKENAFFKIENTGSCIPADQNKFFSFSVKGNSGKIKPRLSIPIRDPHSPITELCLEAISKKSCKTDIVAALVELCFNPFMILIEMEKAKLVLK